MQPTVLQLLQQSRDTYLSGESMSAELGITRAAVWKQIRRLRDKGYEIDAVTNLGYRLIAEPEPLSGAQILSALGDHPWRDRIHVFDSIDSTNSALNRDGDALPHGTIYISDEQTGGRGRQGRSFSSPKGVGVYFSLLLRPQCAPTEVSHVTAMVAEAMCDAIEAATGLRPGIKWTNDLILGGKKLAGILTEMSVEWESATLKQLIIGIGINCNHKSTDFPPEVQEIATSLAQQLGTPVDRCRLCAEMVRSLHRMSEEILTGKQDWLRRYTADCITIGKQVRVIRGSDIRTGFATGLDKNGGLIVRYDGGETGVVYSGEVSVRGLYGYA